MGTEGEVSRLASLPGSTTRRMPSKKTARMGDEGKAVGGVPPTALLCLSRPVEKLRTFQKYSASLEEIEHRANSFSCCGCVERSCDGRERNKNQQHFASGQIVLASFVDNLPQAIQWFRHSLVVLRTHFLRHQTV
jgi:hypothetical protein